MTNSKFDNLFKNKPRKPEKEKISQFHMDIASSIQEVTEEIMLKMTKSLRDEYQIKNLCLAGGVALNCVANGKINKKKIFENIWIQPAAGDAGGSLGAALAFWYNELDNTRIIDKNDKMKGSYLGPKFSDEEIELQLNKSRAIFKKYKYEDMIKLVAKELSKEKAVGWFQGNMEFGPRALGARSILASANDPTINDLSLIHI